MNPTKKKRLYTDIQLQSAISAVKEGLMGISEASLKFGIPKATLHDKINKKYTEGATSGAHTVLTKDEEGQLVSWILYLSDVGFPVTKHNLISSVKNLVTNLQRENPFKDGKPGRHWYEGFMSRHPELSVRVSQSLTAPRAKISEESIRAWFGRVETYFKKENLEEVLTDPRRIFNCDESAFYLSPKENSVIVKKGSNRVYSRAANDEKECLTVLVTVSADGNMQPPLVIFPYKRTPASIILNMPPKWSIGRSDSGWMTGETFYEQITNVFYPWLIQNNIPLPVILFMDGHSSHINLPLSEFCREKKIILTALLPNSTHRLQPLDVAVFRPLKHHWKEQRQTDNQTTKLKREDFAKALDLCIKNAALNDAIINGFRTCGLYPFDANNIDYSKLITPVETIDKNIASEIPTKTTRTTATLLAEVEMRISESELEEFRSCEDTWLGDPKNEGLYYFWKKINDECLEEETLNANINNINRVDLDCNTDWLCNSEVLNLEVQPDGSLAVPDMQLPCLPENSCKVSNLTEHPALDMQLTCRSENTCEITTLVESSTALEKVNLIPETNFIDSNKPTGVETPESSPKTPTKAILPGNRSALTEITNHKEALAYDKPCLPDSSCKINNISESSAPLEEVNLISEGHFEDHKKPSDVVVPESLHKTPLKAVQTESRSVLTPLKTVTFEDIAALRNQTHSTPEKPQEISIQDNAPSCSNINVPTPLKHINTPFKNALFWPEVPKKDNKFKIKKKLTPTVATSEEFIAYQKKIDSIKKEKERIKEEKKSKQINSTKDVSVKKKKIIKGNNNTMLDTEQSTSTTKEKNVGNYVVVNYEGEFFPGIITEIKSNETLVKTMAMSGLNWKWPIKDDIVGYQDDEIVCNIKCPNPINKRGVFSVPEIDTLRSNK